MAQPDHQPADACQGTPADALASASASGYRAGAGAGAPASGHWWRSKRRRIVVFSALIAAGLLLAVLLVRLTASSPNPGPEADTTNAGHAQADNVQLSDDTQFSDDAQDIGPQPPDTGLEAADPVDYADLLMQAVNSERQALGLDRLQASACAQQEAQRRVQALANGTGELAHVNPGDILQACPHADSQSQADPYDSADPASSSTLAGPAAGADHGSQLEGSTAGQTFHLAGENLSAASASPDQVVAAWMNSAGHRMNIVNPDFTHAGMACLVDLVNNAATMVCVNIFLG